MYQRLLRKEQKVLIDEMEEAHELENNNGATPIVFCFFF